MFGFWCLCGGIGLVCLAIPFLNAESGLAQGVGLLIAAMSGPTFALALLDFIGVQIQ